MSESSTKSLRTAVLLIAVGGLFLLNNLGLLPSFFATYFFGWEGLLLLIGTLLIFSPERRVPGIILMGLGGFFIAEELVRDLFDTDFISWNLFWPVLLIVGGLWLLARRQGWLQGSEPTFAGDDKETHHEDVLDITAILGGGDLTLNSKNLRGGEITAILGGGTYDLSHCELAPGPQYIDVTAIMGGASLIVPSHWKVRTEVTAIFGGFSDSRKRPTAPLDDSPSELIIRGTVIFGGGEIKNFV